MKAYERPVKFQDVDAAGIVFFGHFSSFAHEAMEHFFSELEGGYPGLIVGRRVGVPAVDVRVRFLAPVRYGDTLRVEVSTAELGRRSATLHYRMVRTHDGVLAAEMWHKVVSSDLVAMRSCDMPADVRATFERHRETGAAPAPG